MIFPHTIVYQFFGRIIYVFVSAYIYHKFSTPPDPWIYELNKTIFHLSGSYWQSLDITGYLALKKKILIRICIILTLSQLSRSLKGIWPLRYLNNFISPTFKNALFHSPFSSSCPEGANTFFSDKQIEVHKMLDIK